MQGRKRRRRGGGEELRRHHRAERGGSASQVHPLLPSVRQRVQARRQSADAHAGARRRVQVERRPEQPDEERRRRRGSGVAEVFVPAGRVQVEQEARAVHAAEVDDLREESLQEKPLSEDVRVQEMQQEAVLGAVGFEDAREALRRPQMAVFVRDHVFAQGQAHGTRGLVRRPRARRHSLLQDWKWIGGDDQE